MWTAKNRRRYDRSALRYPSDLTDDEWARVGSLIPPARRGGNKLSVDVREVMNGIMYVLSTGCQWRAIPNDLPPRSTLFDYLDLWSYDGTLEGAISYSRGVIKVIDLGKLRNMSCECYETLRENTG